MKKIKIDVLLENESYLVINKPAGLMVHSDGRSKEPTLVDWLLETYPKIALVGQKEELQSGEEVLRPGIVHRLDRDTSGAMLIAKTKKAFSFLQPQFEGREVEKIYHAFVYGEMKEEDGVIDRPIARSSKDFRLWSAQRGGKGKAREALTEYKVLGRTKTCSLVEIIPKTGRTHQIRVHFKAISHPVVCDSLYAPKMAGLLGFERLALHARKLSFKDEKNKLVSIEAPYPKDFKIAIKDFELVR